MGAVYMTRANGILIALTIITAIATVAVSIMNSVAMQLNEYQKNIQAWMAEILCTKKSWVPPQDFFCLQLTS